MTTGFRNFIIVSLVVLLGLSGFAGYSAWNTGSNLADAESTIASLEKSLSSTRTDLSQAQTQISGMTGEISTLKQQTAQLLADATAVQDAAAEVLPSMVFIQTASGSGSGVIMDSSGYILTNKHVIEGADFAYVVTQDRKIYESTDIRADTLMDLAVIKINASGLPAAEFGDTASLRTGDTIVALGNPLGYSPADYGSTVTAGIASNFLSWWYLEPGYWYPDLIQFDVFITNGNSGGPLINLDGEVIGINSLGEEPGINYAISGATAERVYLNLKNLQSGNHPFLGVDVYDFERPVSGQPGVTQLLGAEVWSVETGSPASTAGLKAGDVIVAADGQTIGLWSDLARAVFRASPGDTMSLTIERSGVTSTITIILGERPAGTAYYIF